MSIWNNYPILIVGPKDFLKQFNRTDGNYILVTFGNELITPEELSQRMFDVLKKNYPLWGSNNRIIVILKGLISYIAYDRFQKTIATKLKKNVSEKFVEMTIELDGFMYVYELLENFIPSNYLIEPVIVPYDIYFINIRESLKKENTIIQSRRSIINLEMNKLYDNLIDAELLIEGINNGDSFGWDDLNNLVKLYNSSIEELNKINKKMPYDYNKIIQNLDLKMIDPYIEKNIKSTQIAIENAISVVITIARINLKKYININKKNIMRDLIPFIAKLDFLLTNIETYFPRIYDDIYEYVDNDTSEDIKSQTSQKNEEQLAHDYLENFDIGTSDTDINIKARANINISFLKYSLIYAVQWKYVFSIFWENDNKIIRYHGGNDNSKLLSEEGKNTDPNDFPIIVPTSYILPSQSLFSNNSDNLLIIGEREYIIGPDKGYLPVNNITSVENTTEHINTDDINDVIDSFKRTIAES